MVFSIDLRRSPSEVALEKPRTRLIATPWGPRMVFSIDLRRSPSEAALESHELD